METANATRPNLATRKAELNRLVDKRMYDCILACTGIANPSAIPALIEAARYEAQCPDAVTGLMLAKALAALDAEPVA